MTESFKPTAETSDSDTDTETGSDRKDASKKKRALQLGRLPVEKDTPLPLHEAKDEGRAKSVAERFAALLEQPVKEKDVEQSEAETTDIPTDKLEYGPEQHDTPDNAEEAEVMQLITESDRAEALEEAASGEGVQAEVAAKLALLDAVDRKIEADPDRPVEEAIEEAAAETLVKVDEAAAAAAGAVEPGSTELPESAIESEDEVGKPPIPPTGGSGAAGGNVPLGPPPAPPVPPAASGPSFGGAGGGPFMPRGPSAGFNRAPAAATAAAERAQLTREHNIESQAVAQGLLVGGIVGYLIGKRRGRIKTERRLVPIQQKLEKRVTELQNALAAKERSVRKYAAEKAGSIRTVEAKQQFAERLAPEMAITSKRAAETSKRERQADVPAAERVGRVLVEAPAVVLAGVAAIRPERIRTTPLTKERPVIDFSKRVEAYSRDELKQTAEKVEIDGTSLRELYDSGRLDETAVRRVMTEFVEGGNVRAAVSRELLEKELKYERDPNLRNATAPADGGPSGGGASVTNQVTTDSQSVDAQTGDPTSVLASANGKKPVPDQATLDKLRKQQITQVATAGGVVAFLVLALILMLT